MTDKNKTEGATLYVVATPIGNLSDITERAKKTLSEVDFVAAEDTRNTAKLLSLYGIRKELISYHEHNKKSAGERVLARLLSGDSCALVSDAGMPAISDPGEDLVRLCAEAGVRVCVIPGASASVSALAVSALSTARFVFEGFLPVQQKRRKERLRAISSEERTLILYEAPHKLKATLSDLATALGEDRRISLCRELTKINEEIIRTTVGCAVKLYETTEPRGEYVLVIEGADGAASEEENPLCELSPSEHVLHYVNEGYSKMEATKLAAKDRGMSKSELYKIINS